MERLKNNWQDEAVCREIGTNVFLDEEIFEENFKTIERVCNSCPVKQECVEFAVTNKLDYGIYGGMYGATRKKLGKLLIKGE